MYVCKVKVKLIYATFLVNELQISTLTSENSP
jgi:hypothetical protein